MSDSNGNTPNEEPMGALLQAAISMHELYVSFLTAGFTESQALYLVSQSLRPQNPNA